MKRLLIFLILIGFTGPTSFTLISAYGDGKTISGDYTPIANGIISLDGDLFFISKSFAIQTEANIVESFHGVNFTIPYDPNPPVPGGIRSTTIVFSDGITETLSRGTSSDIKTTLSNHVWPIAGLSRHLDNTFYFLVSIDSESSLKQFKSGIHLEDIRCKQDFILIQKIDETPACVKSKTGEKLLERGWTKCTGSSIEGRGNPCGPHSSGVVSFDKQPEPESQSTIQFKAKQLGIDNIMEATDSEELSYDEKLEYIKFQYGEDGPAITPSLNLRIKDLTRNLEYGQLPTFTLIEAGYANQELGYAQGKNISIIPLIEEGAKIGVLIYGFDAEKFTRENFNDACKNVRDYIVKIGPKKKTLGKLIDSTDFLKKRKIDNPESSDFAENEHTGLLKTQIDNELAPNGKSIVLFSACPQILRDMVDVHSKEFTNWLENQNTIKINKHNSPFFTGKKSISLDLLTYYNDVSGQGDIYSYLEIRKNGFLEEGITRSIIYSSGTQKGQFAFLNLCFLTGAYWTFLTFCKMFYEKIRLDDKFDVILSIRNSKDLTLLGFGGKLAEGNRKWAEPYDIWWDGKMPQTNLSNISLKLESITKKDLTDNFIITQVRKISYQISNAYGLDSSKCYNHDGTFNFELFSHYNL